MNIFKQLIFNTFLYSLYRPLRQRIQLLRWDENSPSGPVPHIIKQKAVLEYASRFGIGTLVETGTYLGDMLCATRRSFARVYSIELDDKLYKRACRRYGRYANISLLHGDSAALLSRVLGQTDKSLLFWLDAHYSGGITAKGALESPILRELMTILDHPVDTHVVLIDDANNFNGSNSYPTADRVLALVRAKRPGWLMEIKHNIIRLHPPFPQKV